MKNLTNPFQYSIATRIRNKHFLRLLKLKPGESALDVGCGLGYFTRLLSVKDVKFFGIDIDPKAILFAKEDTNDSEFLVGEAEHLPFKGECFNKVLCSEVLEHIQNDTLALSEIYRVCKDNALVVITVPTEEGIFRSKIKRIGHEDKGKNSSERHYRNDYTRTALEMLLKENGILPIESRYSMVFFAELFMGFTKAVYLLKCKSLESQIDVLKVKDSPVLRLYRMIFPFILLVSKFEELLLAKLFKGHLLIMVGVVRKNA